ncbi:MAG: FAD-dependent oxidoreductase, partial [Betaproteobacteria bacterium]
MPQTIEVKVPDIGDFNDVPVIEVLVKVGDTVKPEDSLVTLESDKATLDIPAPSGGTVREMKVKVGDKVSEGTVIMILDGADLAGAKPAAGVIAPAPRASAAQDAAPPAPKNPPGAPLSAAAVNTDSFTGTPDVECEMLVLGAGPGGYSAAFRAADLGMSTVLVERYGSLGGVCLNVGCIPSKALLHVAGVMEEAKSFAAHGVSFGAPEVDLAKLREWKRQVVGKLTGGLTGMAKARKVVVVRGYGVFLDAHHLEVDVTEGSAQDKTGTKKIIRFGSAIIAAGSQAVRLPFVPEDPRIVDSTGALELRGVPKRMLVIGGGIIGLEMATVYSALGARLEVVEMLDGLMQGADRDLVKVWDKMNRHRFDKVMLKTKTVAVDARPDAVHVTFEGEQAPAGPQPYDLVLVAVGRSPNGGRIGAERAGIEVSARGFVAVDAQMRTNVRHIFAIGDVVGQPMLAHKATHEGHVAAEAAAGQ